MDKTLRYAAYAGIITLILTIPVTLYTLYNGPPGTIKTLLYTTYYLAGIIVMWGFKTIAEKTDNKLMKTTTYLMMTFMTACILIVATQKEITANITYNSFAIIYGITGTAFAISLFKLEKQFGKTATATAITDMIFGLQNITIYTITIYLLLLENTNKQPPTIILTTAAIVYLTMLATGILTGILEVIILYKASKEL